MSDDAQNPRERPLAIHSVKPANELAIDWENAFFCRSSVELWSNLDIPLQWQSVICKNKESYIRFIFATDRSAPHSPSYIINIDSNTSDNNYLSCCISDLVELIKLSKSKILFAFARVESFAAVSLEHLGWSFDRMFPVQIVWDGLNRFEDCWTMGQDEEVVVRESHNSYQASELFIDCFLDQWEWYFERMGYRTGISSKSDLQNMALRYVRGADIYFIASVLGKPVGLNSATFHSGSNRGELHTGVGVLPLGRGRGIGVRLVKHALNWLHDRGAVSAEIRTQEVSDAPNANIKTYLRCGGARGHSYKLYRHTLV